MFSCAISFCRDRVFILFTFVHRFHFFFLDYFSFLLLFGFIYRFAWFKCCVKNFLFWMWSEFCVIAPLLLGQALLNRSLTFLPIIRKSEFVIMFLSFGRFVCDRDNFMEIDGNYSNKFWWWITFSVEYCMADSCFLPFFLLSCSSNLMQNAMLLHLLVYLNWIMKYSSEIMQHWFIHIYFVGHRITTSRLTKPNRPLLRSS